MSEETRRKVAPWQQQAASRDETIDKAIDSAVRDFMNVDADPAFRARVLARLEGRPTRLSWRRLTLAAAATAVVVLVVVLMRPQNTVVQPRTNRSTPDVASTRPAQNGQSVGALRSDAQADEIEAAGRPRPRVAQAFRPAPPRSRTSPSRRLVAAAVVETTPGVEIEPLTEIEAIQVSPVEQSAITPSPIVVAPLTPLEALEIEPLSPQIQRD